MILHGLLGHTGSLDRPPTRGARIKAAMVEFTDGNCASSPLHLPRRPLRPLCCTLGAEAGFCQEDLTSSRKIREVGGLLHERTN